MSQTGMPSTWALRLDHMHTPSWSQVHPLLIILYPFQNNWDYVWEQLAMLNGKTQLSGLRGEVPQDKWLRTKGRRDKEKNKEVKAELIDIKEVWDISTNCNMWNLFVIKKLLLILLRQWYYDYIFINYINAYFKIIHGLPWWLSTK